MATHRLASETAFEDRVVLVTGGGGFLGTSIALAFAKAGAKLVLNDLPGKGGEQAEGPADRVAKEIQSLGAQAIAVTSSVLEGKKIIERAIEAFGRIDIIVNAAGVEQTKRVEEETFEDFKRVIEVNTLGTVSTILAAWPHFKNQRFGRVINVISDTIFGQDKLTSYIFAKGAVFAGTRALAIEGSQDDILVNSVAPIAASPMALKHLDSIDPETREWQKKWLVDKFPAESNVPMILALAHDSNTITGEAFSVGAWSVSRIVLGFQQGIIEAKTMVECLNRMADIVGDHEVKIPKDTLDYGKLSRRGKD